VAAPFIVVLGCGVGPDGVPNAALRRRIETGADAWNRGLAPAIIASGGRRWSGHAEALVMARELERLGIPSAAVHVELRSLTTQENAHYCRDLVRRLAGPVVATAPLPGLVLVSSDWHLRRAVGDFERAGFRCAPLAAQSPPRAVSRVRAVGEHGRILLGQGAGWLRRI
jgi:uncharacterized SAM-binding protein YcdF (DUF218 family)